MPDRNRDASDEDLANIDSYGDVLCTLFDEWLEVGQSSIKIRQFEELLRHFSGKFEFLVLPKMYTTNQIIVIHTDGHIAIDDTLMPTMSWYRETQTADVRSTSLKEWLSQRVFNDIRDARSTLPAECVDCRWSGICRGGDIENRFSEADGFAGKSVYCGALMKFYEHVACTLIQGGYPLDQLTKVIERERPISVGAVA